MMDNGSMTKSMAKVLLNGLMELTTKVNGLIIIGMARDTILSQMVTHMIGHVNEITNK